MSDVLTGYVERGEVPGLVALVARRGEVHVEAIGTARDAIFRIASMSKPVTATAAMVLVEEGVIRLDDPVDPLLPELANRAVLRNLEGPVEDTVPAHRPITLRDLLTFTLGTGLVFAMPGTYPIQEAIDKALIHSGPPDPSRQAEPDEWMRRLGTLPLIHQPGDRWMYNTGSEVLSVMIARASGKPLGDFLQERIFRPLGMRDTEFWVPPQKIDRLADSYEIDPATGKLVLYDEAAGGKWSRPPAFPSGAGGLVSTADDFLRFGQMMLNRGTLDGRRILARPSVETMTMDHLTLEQKSRTAWVPGYFDTHGWGFGLSVVTRRHDLASTPGKYGWDGGLGTTWSSDPVEEMVTILLTQVGFTSPIPPAIHRDFSTLAYAAIDD
jgi:CubicO group peptidase (beta-lactamase class C family)